MVCKGCFGFDNNIMRAERYETNIIYNSRVFARHIINNCAYRKKMSFFLYSKSFLRISFTRVYTIVLYWVGRNKNDFVRETLKSYVKYNGK